MADTVFIFGAGASQHAGAPLMYNFFDKARELRRLDRLSTASRELCMVEDALAELQRTAAKSSINLYNLESVWGALEMAEIIGSLGTLSPPQIAETIASLRKVIVATLESSIRYRASGRNLLPPTGYAKFCEILREISQKHQPKSTAILSFNYDCALDYSLKYYNNKIDYCFQENQSPGTVGLCKLHGSLNWIKNGTQIESIELTPIDNRDFSSLGWAGQSLILADAREDAAKRCGGSADPIIVPPTDSKLGDRRQLAAIWRHAARHLGEASQIIVVGFSLPATDEFFRSFFGIGTISRNPLELFAVVDPCPKAAQRHKRLLSLNSVSRFESISAKFEESSPYIQKLIGV